MNKLIFFLGLFFPLNLFSQSQSYILENIDKEGAMQGLKRNLDKKLDISGGTVINGLFLKNCNLTFSTATSSYGIVFQDGTSMVTSSVGAIGVTANPLQFTGNGTASSILNLVLSSITALGNSLEDAEIPDTISLTNITQITNRSHTNLSDIGVFTHAQVDTRLNALAVSTTTVAVDTTTLQTNIDLKVAKAGDTMTGNLIVSNSSVAVSGTGIFQGDGSGITGLTDSQIPDTITLTNITQVTNRSHTNLSDIGTNTHAQIDSQLNTLSTTYVNVEGDTMTGQLTLSGSTLTITGSAFSVGTSTLVVKSGNIGVGLTNPSYGLDVLSSKDDFTMQVKNTGASGEGLYINMTSGLSIASALEIKSPASASALFVVRNNGNVGINTLSPNYKLDVEDGDINADSYYGDGSNLTKISSVAVNSIYTNSVINNAITSAKLDTSISVSTITVSTISTTASLLYISTTMRIGGYTMPFVKGSANYVLKTDGDGIVTWQADATGGGSLSVGDTSIDIIDAGDGYITFTEDNSEKMRITGGNIGIGITNPAKELYVYKSKSGDATRISVNNPHSGGAANIEIIGNAGEGALQYIGSGFSAIPDLVDYVRLYTESTATGLILHSKGGAGGIQLWTASSDSRSNNERMRIASGGNIGIGTTNPTEKLHIIGNTTHTKLLVAVSPLSSGTASCIFADDTGVELGGFQFFDNAYGSAPDLAGYSRFYGESASSGTIVHAKGTAGGLQFWVGNSDTRSGTERMRIDSNGNVGIGTTSPGAKLDVSGGVISVSTGIAFPSTQIDSVNVNTLDDYEEGTWTATMRCSASGTITLNANTMRYTKIGRMVFLEGCFTVASVSSPQGAAYITGFPFTNAIRHAGSVWWDGMASGVQPYSALDIATNTTEAAIYGISNGVVEATNCDNFQANVTICFQATYSI